MPLMRILACVSIIQMYNYEESLGMVAGKTCLNNVPSVLQLQITNDGETALALTIEWQGKECLVRGQLHLKGS